MNLEKFLQHWGIRENPFLAEEARHDDVFLRLGSTSQHPDMPKILGQISLPAPAVVFGEKGSGKTALRLQIEDAVHEYNKTHPDERVMIIAYDDLNPILDRFARRVTGAGKAPSLETLRKLHLNDHIDGILSVAVPIAVDAALSTPESVGNGHIALGRHVGRKLRRMPRTVKRDWLLLQTLYDRPQQVADRTASLRKRLGYRRLGALAARWGLIKLASRLFWALALIALVLKGLIEFNVMAPAWAADVPSWAGWAAIIVLALPAAYLTWTDIARRRIVRRRGQHFSRHIRIVDRSADSFRACFAHLPTEDLQPEIFHLDNLDDTRYAMLARLRRAVRPFGYDKIVILVDRVDEPTAVSGDPDRMWAIARPLLHSKFLQQAGEEHDRRTPKMAVKLMLPLELRRMLDREDSELFQQFRPDKANMIDRLEWSGSNLYDLCSSRLVACLGDNGIPAPVVDDESDDAPSEVTPPLNLMQLFDDTVTRDDVVHALGEMAQPRDAFKMMYEVLRRHCDTVTDEEEAWLIPKHVLDHVMGHQRMRLERLRRGWGGN